MSLHLLKACDGLAIHPVCFPAFGPETMGWASPRHYVGQAVWRMDGSAPKRKTTTQNAHWLVPLPAANAIFHARPLIRHVDRLCETYFRVGTVGQPAY